MSSSDFNPRSPHGERRHKPGAPLRDSSISIHAPRTGSDFACSQPVFRHVISIHAPRTGSDESPDKVGRGLEMISIHAPRTGSDHTARAVRRRPIGHFNPRSPHGERRESCWRRYPRGHISIHAPRTGSDCLPRGCFCRHRLFQSTLPARGATERNVCSWFRRENFNPRSPHGERQDGSRFPVSIMLISIHAPRTGSDDRTPYPACLCKLFQSTLPARGATYKAYGTPQEVSIFQSTLPARGATLRLFLLRICVIYFNPRSPHGERHQ